MGGVSKSMKQKKTKKGNSNIRIFRYFKNDNCFYKLKKLYRYPRKKIRGTTVREMESPACGGVASCAGQHAACLHPPRGWQQQGSALPCSLLSQWTWWVSIRQIGGCVPSTGFTLNHPHLVPPHPLMCVLHTGSGRQGQSPWDTVADCVMVPYHCAGRARGAKGARPCLDSKRQKGHCSPLMTPLFFLMFGR